MTATSYIELCDQTYAITTNVGSGRVRVGYRDGAQIAMWDPEEHNPWVITYEGFDSFLRSGHMSQMLDYLKQFNLLRRVSFKCNTPKEIAQTKRK